MEERLGGGLDVDLPEECENNAAVIQQLLQDYGPVVVPPFSSLKPNEVAKIAGSVAYLLRPDLIISPENLSFLPTPVNGRGVLRIRAGQEDSQIHLRNDPSALCSDWELPQDIGEEYKAIAAEFFRCYAATISFIPGMNQRLDPSNGNSFSSAFSLADMTSYLLDPWDLTDYRYSGEEITRFEAILLRQMREI